MATYSTYKSVHKTLTGTTVDTVDTTGYFKEADVLNRSAPGAADLYVTYVTYTDDPPPNPVATTPVAAANDTEIVPAGTVTTLRNPTGAATCWQVKIIGNGNDYSVIGRNGT